MFLRCNPSVFVIGDEYEITVVANDNGLFGIEIEGERFFPENSGTFPSEKKYAKIRVKQTVLDSAKKYSVLYRKSIDRKPYFPVFGAEEKAEYRFYPVGDKEEIKAYMIADVHYRFALAEKTVAYYGDDTDFYIVNGDIGEVVSIENHLEVLDFVGRIAKGERPVLFVRGNHDIRGRYAEAYTEFFPANGQKTYFPFEIGRLCGVAFDCGEDKVDNHPEYGGGMQEGEEMLSENSFVPYRKAQTEFFKTLSFDKKKTVFAVGHTCPVQTTFHKGDEFDIERETFAKWNAEFERMGVEFMLCAHQHVAHVLLPNDESSTLPHNYPVVIGTECLFKDEGAEKLFGTAILFKKDKTEFAFTDENKNVKERFAVEK